MREPRGRPAPYRGPLREILHWLAWLILSLCGWKMRGDWPAVPKAVLIAAPHTSNWDGIWMLLAAAYLRINVKWMGKKSLTTGPLGRLVLAVGCVPVDRAASNDLVRTMADAFAAQSSMYLLVPPEGTRGRRDEWKTGFYHIARQANVPLILTVMDYGTRTIRIAGLFTPTGDYAADITLIRAQYRGAVGKHPAKFVAEQ